jgi:hypothetical protein
MSSKLQLKHDQADEGQGKCPSCGAAMAEGAVLCVACGFDTRTGRRADDTPPPKHNPVLIASLALVVVAAGVIAVIRATGSGQEAPVPSPIAAPAAPPPAATSPIAPPPGSAAATNASATNVQVEASVTQVDTSAPPAEPEVDWTAIEHKQRELAAAQLDKVAPFFEAGQPVELRMTNGIVHRGILRALTDELLTLEIASNDVRQINLSALDRGTRVRADLDFRDRYLDFHAHQRVREQMKAAAAE